MESDSTAACHAIGEKLKGLAWAIPSDANALCLDKSQSTAFYFFRLNYICEILRTCLILLHLTLRALWHAKK